MDTFSSSVLFGLVLCSILNGVCCQLCPSREEIPPGSLCICDLGDNYNGWMYNCVNETNFQPLFDVKYVVDTELTYRCSMSEPYKLEFFKQSHFSQIQAFVFKSCPLPNSSFSEILPNRNVVQLKIEMKHGDGTFTASLFKNISSNMSSLILNHNEIISLPENIFNSFVRLKFLSLSDNLLKTLPSKLFWELPTLTVLELANNHLEYLPEDLFQGLFQLEKLYLYKNKLKRLPSGLFRGLSALRVLDLADNSLILLPGDIFVGLSQLANLRLRANLLEKLPKELFNFTDRLQGIDLSLNKFQEPLPEELFFGLSSLENVSINDCNLSRIHEKLFAYSSKMTHIKLQNNVLFSLPERLLSNNPKLKEINLNNNKITSLPGNIFPNQKQLEKVSLFQNSLSSLPPGLFGHARSVKTLILGRNRIVNASAEIFNPLPDVEVIDLSNNNLSYFSLSFNPQVKRIDLSYNQLKKVPMFNWEQHLKMENLNLQYNLLTSISVPVMYSANKRSPQLYFGYNKISRVDVQEIALNDRAIKGLSAYDYEKYVESVIYLHPNPFLCDCRLHDFYNYLHNSNVAHKRTTRFTHTKDFTCEGPPELKQKKIMLLDGNQFRCRVNDSCEPPCTCFLRAADKANIMDCANRGLNSLPEDAPLNTNILFLQGNSLTDLYDFNASIWQNLTELYLDRNKIKSLENLYIPPNLKTLTLNGNLLKSIPESILNFTAHAESFHLSLSENPWSCNCSTMYFKKWISEHYQKVEDVRNVTCYATALENGTYADFPIVTISDDIMCPINDWPYKLQLISVTTVCVILALLLFVVSVLYYRNKQTVIAYVYIHLHNVFMCFFNEEDMDEDKIFDAFVSYSGSDRDVAMMLIQELEKKDPYFKLCIHERNWLPGNLISWNIINSVQNSRRTILVISKAFLESMWFQVEFHAAYCNMLEDKIDRVIIIVKGDLPPKDTMDKDLQLLLSTKTYLVWGEKWFWEKLRYALPHKKHAVVNGDIMALKDKPDNEKVKCIENQIAVLSSISKTGNKQKQDLAQNGTNNALNLIIQDPGNNNKTSC